MGSEQGILSRVTLWRLLAFALALHLAVGLCLPNIFYADEVLQAVEPAYRALSGWGMIAWEWEAGARSWLLPGALVGAMWPAYLAFGPGPSLYAAVVVFCALTALIGVAGAYATGRQFGRMDALCAAFAVATWHELVFFRLHPFSESVASSVLLAALCFAVRPTSPRSYALAGFLLMSTLVLRMHLAPAVAIAGLWSLWRGSLPRGWFYLGLGALPPLAVAGLVDWATWGAPFSSYVANFRFNIVESGADQFGVSPATAYIRELLARYGAFAAIYAALALLGARRTPLPLLVAGAIILTHSLVAHKEYRFILPAIAALTLSAGLGIGVMAAWVTAHAPKRAPVYAAALAVWTAASVSGAGEAQIHNRDWTNLRVLYQAFWRVGAERDACGVGLIGMAPFWTPGSSALPRNMPLYAERGAVAQHAEAYNILIAYGASAYNPTTFMPYDIYPVIPARFEERQCFQGPGQTACVYRREGDCDRATARPLNAPSAAPREDRARRVVPDGADENAGDAGQPP